MPNAKAQQIPVLRSTNVAMARLAVRLVVSKPVTRIQKIYVGDGPMRSPVQQVATVKAVNAFPPKAKMPPSVNLASKVAIVKAAFVSVGPEDIVRPFAAAVVPQDLFVGKYKAIKAPSSFASRLAPMTVLVAADIPVTKTKHVSTPELPAVVAVIRIAQPDRDAIPLLANA
jgi:hypothetical protein